MWQPSNYEWTEDDQHEQFFTISCEMNDNLKQMYEIISKSDFKKKILLKKRIKSKIIEIDLLIEGHNIIV